MGRHIGCGSSSISEKVLGSLKGVWWRGLKISDKRFEVNQLMVGSIARNGTEGM